jgi:hypothetical protein
VLNFLSIGTTLFCCRISFSYSLFFNTSLIMYLFAGGEVEEAIGTAVKEAEDRGIRGKEVTPFILNRVISLTEGKSLASSIL